MEPGRPARPVAASCRGRQAARRRWRPPAAKRPIGRLAEAERDRRRDRLPLLRARLLRRRRRLVSRRRHSPGDHLMGRRRNRGRQIARRRSVELLRAGGGGCDGGARAARMPRCWCRSTAGRSSPAWSSPSAAPTCAATPARSRFPGGRQDEGDVDLMATALREAEEEIGLDPAAVELSRRPRRRSAPSSPATASTPSSA